MALTKKDKQDIGQIVEEIVDTKLTREIGSLRLEMNQRFDEASIENKSEHQEIIQKIEQIKQMETEDVQVLYRDVARLKKKIAITS